MSDTDQPDDDTQDDIPLAIAICMDGDTRMLTVMGDLDLTSYERFRLALTGEVDLETRVSLVLDLTGVEYIDARTWLTIADARRQLVARGRPFSVMLESGRQPERVYRTLALDQVVPRF